MFNLMLTHGYTPADLLKSTIISIPKDVKSSLSSSDNYRGISLFNAVCKLFDKVILYLYKDELKASDMQFGFKEGHSTTMCSLIYQEVISHYLDCKGDVYSCLLDASKAFDRVHYGILFRRLLDTSIPKCVIRLIFDSYVRQQACTMWNSAKSQYFNMSNGVKQGGVISPVFFSLYIDPLLFELSKSGYGCHIKGIYMGVLSYADDITLLCPSIGGLNEMIKICSKFAESNCITFNSKKTLCIKYGRDVVNNETAFFKDTPLQWVNKVRHLGNLIDNSGTDYVDCMYKKSMFIGYVNKLRSNYGMQHHSVLIRLFKSYCCSFYGSNIWKFNSKGFDKCCKSWNIAVRHLLNLQYNTHTWLLGPLVGQSNIRTQLYVRNYRFLWYAFRSSNRIVRMCMNNAMYNSNTNIGYKFAFYRYKFDLDMYKDINFSIARITKCSLNDDDLAIVNILQTLLSARSGQCSIANFTLSEVNIMIQDITVLHNIIMCIVYYYHL